MMLDPNLMDLFKFGVYCGIGYMVVRQLRKDVNGIGIALRSDRSKAERRWKHQIATQIETSITLKEAQEHAKLLREDAWRD